MLERGSKDLQNLAQQYRDAEGDIASDIRQGRGRIDEGYGNLLTRDQRRRDLGRREARSEFTNQETQAESRYGQARDTAGQAFDDARQRVGDSAGQQVSEAGQRSQAGRGTVASDFDTATAKAQQIADQGTASAQDIVVPNAYYQQGANETADLSVNNKCVLTIPHRNQYFENVFNEDTASVESVLSAEVYGRTKEINKIRILSRMGNEGAWITVEEIV